MWGYTNFDKIKFLRSLGKYIRKGGFFSESAIRFLDLQISKKKYSNKLSWTWNKKHYYVMGGNFKFQVQDSFLEYFFPRFGDLKNESHFLKKSLL